MYIKCIYMYQANMVSLKVNDRWVVVVCYASTTVLQQSHVSNISTTLAIFSSPEQDSSHTDSDFP